jgi:hypothetical protein
MQDAEFDCGVRSFKEEGMLRNLKGISKEKSFKSLQDKTGRILKLNAEKSGIFDF